jgi:hypothetical protein
MRPAKMKSYKYVEWLSPVEMHQATLDWLSELNFVRDEQKFLNDLVKTHTLELTDSTIFERSRKLVGDIASSEHEVVGLMKQVQAHENLLEIMIDDVNQPKMEAAYRDTHRDLTLSVRDYLLNYRKLKSNLFGLVSAVIKKEKQKRLLN